MPVDPSGKLSALYSLNNFLFEHLVGAKDVHVMCLRSANRPRRLLSGQPGPPVSFGACLNALPLVQVLYMSKSHYELLSLCLFAMKQGLLVAVA